MAPLGTGKSIFIRPIQLSCYRLSHIAAMSDDRVLEHILNPSAPLTSEQSKVPDRDPVPLTDQVTLTIYMFGLIHNVQCFLMSTIL